MGVFSEEGKLSDLLHDHLFLNEYLKQSAAAMERERLNIPAETHLQLKENSSSAKP